MRPLEEMTAERAAEACAGLHYTTSKFVAASEQIDWEGVWPEINRDGRLTGRVVGSEDGYLNVAGMAMIPVGEAVAGGWQIDRDEGRAKPPARLRWPIIRFDDSNGFARHFGESAADADEQDVDCVLVAQAVALVDAGCRDARLLAALDRLERACDEVDEIRGGGAVDAVILAARRVQESAR